MHTVLDRIAKDAKAGVKDGQGGRAPPEPGAAVVLGQGGGGDHTQARPNEDEAGGGFGEPLLILLGSVHGGVFYRGPPGRDGFAYVRTMKYRLLLLVTALFWGLNYHFGKRVIADAAFAEAGFWRYTFALSILVVVSWRALPGWTDLRRVAGPVLLTGGVALFGFNLGYFLGLRTTSAINGSLIMALNPLTTVLLSALILGTRLTFWQLIGLLVSLAGVLYLVAAGSLDRLLALQLNTGDLFIMGANVSFAFHHVFVRKFGHLLPNAAFTLLVAVACYLSFLIALPLTTTLPSLDHTPSFWLGALGLGVLGTAVAYLCWNAGIVRLGADAGAVALNLVPLFTALGSLVLGEPLLPIHFISGGLIIGGVAIALAGARWSRRPAV